MKIYITIVILMSMWRHLVEAYSPRWKNISTSDNVLSTFIILCYEGLAILFTWMI